MPAFNRDHTDRSGDVCRVPADTVSGGREPGDGACPTPRPEQEFSGFLEAAPDAVVIADLAGRIVRVNVQAEKMFGYPRTELIRREVEMLIPERFWERHVGQRTAYVRRPVSRPMAAGQRLYGLRKDGREFPVEITLSPLAAADGFVVASAIRDVSGQRRMEDELRRRTRELEDAARHKDEFLGMVAHELRNPLGTVCNALEILRQLDPQAPKVQWALGLIGRQSEHMNHLVEDLLDASRVTHGKVRLRHEPVQLDAIVGQAVESCRPLLNVRRHQLSVTLPSRPVSLLADQTRLVQILTNLLNNAAKYTDAGGQIWLTATAEEGEIVVRVRDNGIGIRAEMLPQVFDLFTQVPGATDRSGGGLGIGLAMVNHLVELHGGTVRAFSDGPGRGSEFVVRLPLPSPTSVGRDEGAETIAPSGGGRPRRLLVADDNEYLAKALAQLLRRQGHDVRTVSDGSAAMDVAEVFRPEVVFLDLGLPVLDGYEVARRLRDRPDSERVLLVATAGHADEGVRSRAHGAGFDAHLTKPFSVDKVLDLLVHAAPSHPARTCPA